MPTNGAKVVINGRDETMIDAEVGEIWGAGGITAGTAGEVRVKRALSGYSKRIASGQQGRLRRFAASDELGRLDL